MADQTQTTQPTYQFLNEQGLIKLAEQLLGKVNVRIGERIVTEVNENSTDKQVVSAKTLYNLIAALQAVDAGFEERITEQEAQLGTNATAIQSLTEAQAEQDTRIGEMEGSIQTLAETVNNLTHLTIETVTGNISTVTEPKTDVLYLQRDDEADTTWMMYIYQAPAAEGEAGSWINVGDTEVDLSNYWTKDSIDEMRAALNIHDAEAIPDENIVNAIDTAFANTAVDLTV